MSRQMKPRPKKRFGQHFLRDTGILDRIVERLNPRPGDLILEVGAGYGALSVRLAPRVGKLVAVEVDSDHIAQLIINLSPYPSAVVKCADILKTDLEEILSPYLEKQRVLRIAGNLPYNIATAVIERFFQLPLPVKDMTFLVQLEVAQRIIAMPGTRQYGYFSIVCQHFSEVRMGFKVRPGGFFPRPNVMSAIVTLQPYKRPKDRRFDETLIWLSKAAFAHRRKTILNSLRFNPELEPISEALLARAGIDAGMRAEEVTVSEYSHLTRIYLEDFDRSTGKLIRT